MHKHGVAPGFGGTGAIRAGTAPGIERVGTWRVETTGGRKQSLGHLQAKVFGLRRERRAGSASPERGGLVMTYNKEMQ
jgi:hypothetical protein